MKIQRRSELSPLRRWEWWPSMNMYSCKRTDDYWYLSWSSSDAFLVLDDVSPIVRWARRISFIALKTTAGLQEWPTLHLQIVGSSRCGLKTCILETPPIRRGWRTLGQAHIPHGVQLVDNQTRVASIILYRIDLIFHYTTPYALFSLLLWILKSWCRSVLMIRLSITESTSHLGNQPPVSPTLLIQDRYAYLVCA